MKEVVRISILRCERDADFIYVKLDPPWHSPRHKFLKTRIEVDSGHSEVFVDLLKQTVVIVEEHDAPGAPAATREELTIAVAELKLYYEMQRKKGAKRS